MCISAYNSNDKPLSITKHEAHRMAIRTGKEKKVKTRDREVEFESIDDEIKREKRTERAAGRTRCFTKGIPRRS